MCHGVYRRVLSRGISQVGYEFIHVSLKDVFLFHQRLLRKGVGQRPSLTRMVRLTRHGQVSRLPQLLDGTDMYPGYAE